MNLFLLFTLITLTLSLTVQINNIHFGYRNVYIGTATIQHNELYLTNYRQTKSELTTQNTSFFTIQPENAVLSFEKLVRDYFPEQIEQQGPRLTFRFQTEPTIVITLSSESDSQAQSQLLFQNASIGRDISELDL